MKNEITEPQGNFKQKDDSQCCNEIMTGVSYPTTIMAFCHSFSDNILVILNIVTNVVIYHPWNLSLRNYFYSTYEAKLVS